MERGVKRKSPMDAEQLLYWLEKGSLLTKALALVILDEKTGGEVSRMWKSLKKKW